jgi:Reverse transcriptase (RNA-dependent DNA polymerase)/GAG-pre-integrase domain
VITFHAYNHSPFSRPLPYPSTFSSYNNPSFAVPPPPQPPQAFYNTTRLPNTTLLNQPPPIPNQGQPPFANQQPVHAHYAPPHTFIPASQPVAYHQPVPVSSPSPSLSLPLPIGVSKTLPTVTHIPILTSKHDFFPWDEGVQALIRANGLIGHILDPMASVNPSRPDLAPTPPPILSMSSSPREIEASNRWWAEDNIAQHILLSRLGSIPRGLLPSSTTITRTALSIYKLLTQYYGTCSFADCTELLNSLHNSICTTGRVSEFVSKWRIGLAKLQSAQYTYNVKISISLFVRGLPSIPAFNTLRADLPRRIAAIPHDQDYGAFIDLTETVLELDTIFRPTSQSSLPRPPRITSNPPPTALPVSSVPLSSSAAPDPSTGQVPKKPLVCNNCKSRGLRCVGHTDGTCFQPGGGMAGRREEYMNNKGRIHAMFAECLEEAFSIPDQDLPPDPTSSPTSPVISPTPDSDYLLPPLVNLCVTSSSINPDIREDLYYWCDHKSQSYFAYTSPALHTAALLSMMPAFNALLDSGCTHHIIRDRTLFHNYAAKSISVGTANCGSLAALGTGDVEFRYPFGTQFVTFTLRGCLYAPSAPIHLLSVGALVERGMSCLFSPGGITTISYPVDHAKLPGFAFTATVANRLSFLKLDFIPPVVSAISIAFPATVLPSSPQASPSSFPHLKMDSMLWHRRFGHIGMDATRAALTKDYVTGIKLDGPFVHDHCISCIVGKSPRKSYPFRGNRALAVGELLHMDLCGPFPIQAPRGEKYFFNILDDCSNWGFTFGLRLKSDAFSHYRATEAFLERSKDVVVRTIRCGGELELTAGKMGDHFTSKGIVVQRTVPYAHQQNGKSERYIRTIEEGGQALLADAGLPMSFWLDAMLTRQYLVNRLPTSTLPDNLTPFELITKGRKPDLSHLRVWGCECFVAVPPELRPKAGFKRFRAIFVGYEDHRVGWRVRDLHGKYSFSDDIIFNENTSGRLGLPRSLSPSPDPSSDPPLALRPPRDTARVRTTIGKAYDDILRLKAFRRAARDHNRSQLVDVLGTNGGAGGVADVMGTDGGAAGLVSSVVCMDGDAGHLAAIAGLNGGAVHASSAISEEEPSSSLALIAAFFSLIASASIPDPLGTFSLLSEEPLILWHHLFPLDSSVIAYPAIVSSSPRSFNLAKFPASYSEAMARPDASVWRAAMDREMQSLHDMGAFEEADLPPGEKAIGLKWVYDVKTDSFGNIIPGKEKARLVAQGFNQRPGQYDETYAPVAKMASVRILLTWAAIHDLEIFQFDCKTAFLHAKLRHDLYARPFPGFTTSSPTKVLRILAALYGLRQSAYEFYILIKSLFLDLGMTRCDVDHGIFIGEWSSPPDPSIIMPPSGLLILYVPLHVDDGLGITNSSSLYAWFLRSLSRRLHIVDLGPCSKFLSILIIRDRLNRKIWLSSHVYISELLEEWNLSSCKPALTPFPSSSPISTSSPPNSLPALSDADLVPRYQCLVGCLLYLAIATRPDISYYAMWLGQFNAAPTRAHFLAAKHVLRYLAGTKTLALCLGASSPRVPSTLSCYMQNVGCSDADWASDTIDRKSISGYSFYFQGSLISWSAVKQKSIALSSTEAEYYAMTHAFKEAIWLRTFLCILKFPVPRPFPILSDNQATCSLSNSPAISARSKHIDIRHHFIRDHVQDGSFSTTWIPTADMPADIFTKPLPFPIFSRHRDILGLSIPSIA